MMAIEQHDELETRHAFMTGERKDLVDSIAQTSLAIKRIDETTRQRFLEAFAAINQNWAARANARPVSTVDSHACAISTVISANAAIGCCSSTSSTTITR